MGVSIVQSRTQIGAPDDDIAQTLTNAATIKFGSPRTLILATSFRLTDGNLAVANIYRCPPIDVLVKDATVTAFFQKRYRLIYSSEGGPGKYPSTHKPPDRACTENVNKQSGEEHNEDSGESLPEWRPHQITFSAHGPPRAPSERMFSFTSKAYSRLTL